MATFYWAKTSSYADIIDVNYAYQFKTVGQARGCKALNGIQVQWRALPC